MNESYMSKVNSTCMFEMFRHIKTSCETENPDSDDVRIKYGDLIRFVVSFQWITDLFRYWDEELYDDIIKENVTSHIKEIIDFDHLYKELRGLTSNKQDLFFQLLIDDINQNINLYEVSLLLTGAYNEKHLDFFEMIINALKKKIFMTDLIINVKGYTVDNLSNFHYLYTLDLNMRINAEELVECCKSNPNLRELYIRTNEIYGRLSDIALDNNSLQYLEQFHFLMKPEIDAIEYAPLAKLPKLKELTICGIHEIGTLKSLFRRLAEKNYLHRLTILDVHINDEESLAISQIKSLKWLKCGFIEAKSIGHMSDLCELRELEITSQNEEANALNSIVKILKSTRINSCIIRHHRAIIKSEELSLDILAGLIDISEAPNCSDENTIDTLQSLLKSFANGNLENLKIRTDHNIFQSNRNMILAIAAIKSLKKIDCAIGDFGNIEVLGQLPQLEQLILTKSYSYPYSMKAKGGTQCNSENNIKALKGLITEIASNPITCLQFIDLPAELPISFQLSTELIRIKSLSTLKCSFLDDQSVKCLERLTKLENLEIKSDHKFNSISDVILPIISSSKTNVKINEGYSNSSIIYNSHSKKLELRLKDETDASEFSHLGKMENCHSFIISGECKLGSLYSIIETLAANENQNLKILHIEDVPINYKETLLISHIKTLELINCRFSDPKSLEVDLPHSYYKIIMINELQIPSKIIDFIKYFDGMILIKRNEGLIKLKKNQGKGIIGNYVDICNYAGLAEVKNFETLHIFNKGDDTLSTILTDLALSSNLKELIIADTDAYDYYDDTLTGKDQDIYQKMQLGKYTIRQKLHYESEYEMTTNVSAINSKEVLQISKIASLKQLICGFSDSKNLNTLAELKELQELTITTHPFGSLNGLFKEISSQSLSALQYLVIREKEITLDELKAIAEIKSLKGLQCAFNSPDRSMDILTGLPHLSELCITNHRHGTLFRKLRLFGNCSLKMIIIKGDWLEVQDVSAIAEFKSLEVLNIEAIHFHLNDPLFSFKGLKELQIDFVFGDTAAKLPKNIHENFQQLQKLTIRGKTVDSKELENILQLPALKSLECYLKIEENTNLCRIAQLERLDIIPENQTLKLLLEALIEQTPKTLKHFEINTVNHFKYFDIEPLHLITKLTNLKTLKLTTFDFTVASDLFLNILRDCTELDWIQIKFLSFNMVLGDCSILSKTLNILKMVRDPMLQKPLKLIVPPILYTFSSCLTPSDKQYLNVVYV